MSELSSLVSTALCALAAAALLYFRPALARQRAGRVLFVLAASALAAWGYDSIVAHPSSPDAALAFGVVLLFAAALLKAIDSAGKRGNRHEHGSTPFFARRPGLRFRPIAGNTAAQSLESVLPRQQVGQETDTRHLWLCCTDGNRRRQLLAALIRQYRARGQRVVVADRDGALLRMLWDKDTDVLFNPWDERSVPWSPLSEPAHALDSSQLAQCLLAGSSMPAHIVRKAVELAAQLVEALRLKQQSSLERLLFFVHHASAREIESFLEQAGMTVLVEDEDFVAVRQLLGQTVQGYASLTDSGTAPAPSLFEWLNRTGAGVWFATYFSAEQAAVVRTLLETAVQASLGGAPAASGGAARCIVVDDAEALGRVPSIESSLAKLKKRKVDVVAGCNGWRRAIQAPEAETARALLRHADLKFIAAPDNEDEALDIVLALQPPADRTPGLLPGQLASPPDTSILKTLPRARAAAEKLLKLPPTHWFVCSSADARPLTVYVPEESSEPRADAFAARVIRVHATSARLRTPVPADAVTVQNYDTAEAQEYPEGEPEGLAQATAPRVHKSAVFGKWTAPAPPEQPRSPDGPFLPLRKSAVAGTSSGPDNAAAKENRIEPVAAAVPSAVSAGIPALSLAETEKEPASSATAVKPAADTRPREQTSGKAPAWHGTARAKRRNAFGKADLTGLLK